MAASYYVRMVKQARGFLRGKFMQRFPWLMRLLKPLFKKEYWLPNPHRMALGFAIGIFFAFAMLVFPIQMLCSAFACMFFKGNLPMSLGACWVSNPLTIPPLVWLMTKVGAKLDSLGVDMPELEFSVWGIEGLAFSHFMVGCVSSGIVLGLLSYPIVLGILMNFMKRRKPRVMS